MADWPTCSACPGVRVNLFRHCVAHLDRAEREQFGQELRSGAGLDARGTTITDEVLHWLREAVRDEHGLHVFGPVRFDHAVFPDYGQFEDVEFTDVVSFYNAEFHRPVSFDRARVDGEIGFVNAKFHRRVWLGAIRTTHLNLKRARFASTVEVLAEAEVVSCDLARFEEGANFRLRGSHISAAQAVFGAASSINGDNGSAPCLVSLRGTDVSNLVLTDVDLSRCEFAGAHRLDQLRFAGECTFDSLPPSWRRTRRRMLADERIGSGTPEQVAALYRSLRKAFEDSKNEAGAGDFYYGEMDMRRHAPSTPAAERWILTFYWLMSGYGQRALRALGWLAVLVAVVCVLLFTVGLPGGVDWNWTRIDQSLRIGMGAVVFRDAGQTLTSAGSWTVMVARFAGPVLLALAVLAVRARVKR